MRRLVVALSLAGALAGCRTKERPPSPSPPASAGPVDLPADRFSEAGMLAEATRYLDEPAFRRATLVASLVNPTNTYSKQRLDSYGLEKRGWDLLPEWNPQSLPVTTGLAERLRAGEPLVVDPATPRLWDGTRPTTMAAWVALGREVFFGYPLRSEVFMTYALKHPALAEKVGVRADADGLYPGARAFVDVRGRPAIGITCAICHTNVVGGKTVIGEARRSFDYGALRLAYHETEHVPLSADLARGMKSWGPGRADVTEDDDEDPVAIPDLWGLKHQTFLTQAGTIKHVGPAALAIRQETQLLHSNHQKVRPPRALAYALALYLYSLEAPRGAAPTAATPRGAALFAERCRGCHSNAAFGGDAIAAEKVGTDGALAKGFARGTGNYRPPALLHVSAAGPYFHHGAVPTLEDVLSPDRLAETYHHSPVGRGPVAGHAYGLDLPPADRAAIVDYLRTL